MAQLAMKDILTQLKKEMAAPWRTYLGSNCIFANALPWGSNLQRLTATTDVERWTFYIGNALHALRTRISNNHVIRLDLGNSNVFGTLGLELGQLQHLQYLYSFFPLP
ncbi:hypothetical protein JHK87_001562 [Glycine soja]|nr:hypothetical protein JHK87_001562 [Glycine soja]